MGQNQSFPELKQLGELTRSDFERHPVWIGVHLVDEGQPWYEQCDEATYRPWTNSLPVDPGIGDVLVTATFDLPDGSHQCGFIQAVTETWDIPPKPNLRSITARYGGSQLALLGLQQPRIFVNERRFHFWGGRKGIAEEERRAFYAALGRTQEQIFPLRFRADTKLATGILNGEVDGFYRLIGDRVPQVER